MEGGVEPETGNEGDGPPEAPATLEELQGSIPAVGDGDDLTVWLPASQLQEHLPGPLVTLGVCLALGSKLGGSGPKERKPYPRPGTSPKASGHTP